MRALVLSGGGNRGALQAGALEVLVAEGITFDLLVGTSVGALNAAYLAADQNTEQAKQLVTLWRQLRGRDIFPDPLHRRAANLILRRDHLYTPTGLRRLLEHHLPYHRIQDTSTELVVVATELATGEERRLDHGPAVDAVLASTAIPGVFPPVAWEGILLVDGAISANLPLAAAIAAGATDLWALDATGPCSIPRAPRHALDVALQSIALLGTARTRAELACPLPAVIIRRLALVCRSDAWFSDFSATPELIADGIRSAQAFLDAGAPAHVP
jgi:NTE family protein